MKSVDSLRRVVLSALFASLTAVGALIRIPIPPVPITLQTAFVFLSGGLLGAGSGALSQCIYIGIGLLGIPVFSGGGGIGYIFDPRFGYLIGFPAAAFIIGLLTKQCLKTKFLSEHIFLLYTGVYTLGAGIIYCCGILYLLFYAEKLSMNIPAIIWSGFIIFIPAEILKIIAGAWLTVRLHRIKVLSINKEA